MRWVNLIAYFLVMVSSAFNMTTFSSTSKILATAYNTEQLIVNLGVIVFSAGFVIANFISVKALESGST